MTDFPQKTKAPAANKNISEEDKHDEDSVKAVFVELPFHEEEDEYVEKADFSEHQLHQLFELEDQPPWSDPSKGLRVVVCKLCGGCPASIQEGSSLQDRRAVQEHASIHRDVWHDLPNQWVDQNTSMEIKKPKSYSEAELLRIYVVDPYCIQGYKRHAEAAERPPEELEQVWYAVICKLCYGDVYKTRNKPSCLHKIPKLQDHALRHSDYLCVDGPPVPEIDLEDYNKEWLTSDEYGFLSFEDDAPVPRGFVKICCWCMCENCSSGDYGTVRIQCDSCDDIGTHRTYECPNWQRELGRLIPCNGLKRRTTTLLESLKEDA
ncbi:hypothetical protein ACLB2K_000703 [Fragaria x ananassa]